MGFLEDSESLPLELPADLGLQPQGVFLGKGAGALEVAAAKSAARPTQQALRGAWKARSGRRAVPLLVVAIHGNRASVCGPTGEEPPCFQDLDPGLVERICRTALEEPDRHAAAKFLSKALPNLEESPIPGVRNEGLFATHLLATDVPRRADWTEAHRRSASLLAKRGRELIAGLGYRIESTNQPWSVLRTGEAEIAVAIFLRRGESPDASSPQFNGMTPVQYALAKADERELEYVLVEQEGALRLYTTSSGKGVGRRGRTETFVEVHLGVLPVERAAYLWLLFSGDALRTGGTFAQILDDSGRYATGLGERLRDRVYEEVVPRLAVAIARERKLRQPTAEQLALTYEMALVVLFRLLFIAYAEDKDLLPYRANALYRDHALKTKARRLADLRAAGKEKYDDSTTLWEEVNHLCRAVSGGKPLWGVPAYNGRLFSEEPAVSAAGAELAKVTLRDADFGPVVAALLVDEAVEGPGPVDFRSLGVREFGTIYEGLLESELSVADEDLVWDKDGYYKPAGKKDPGVLKGQVYLHNRSGARKASGTYFTKKFAVDHLLARALEPALAEHLQRVEKLAKDDERKASEAFFDFRVADIAMGSGHFLVAAVDVIEKHMSTFLARQPLAGVQEELATLREAATRRLRESGVSEGEADIDNVQFLRRAIARRCIYGVDINPISVQLAQLSLWIHTFVPGLPLSFLDRTLAVGNSLVGIASMQEIADAFGEKDLFLFRNQIRNLLEPAREHLNRLKKISDLDARQIQQALYETLALRAKLERAKEMFDILTLARIPDFGYEPDYNDFAPGAVETLGSRRAAKVDGLVKKAKDYLKSRPFHFPYAFPDVFLREGREGFDVILGNPPWEEATLEEDDFWSRYIPGFQGLKQHEQEALKKKWRRDRPDLVALLDKEVAEADAMRESLVHGPFPGMGTGDPDLYKAFCWRFWQLLNRDGGRIGVVLPRSAFAAKGSTDFRKELFAKSTLDLTFLLNAGGWVFDEAEPRYTIALSVIRANAKEGQGEVSLLGPFSSLEKFLAGRGNRPACFKSAEIETWNDSASLPLLPAEESVAVFAQLRKAPRLDVNRPGEWRGRPYRELDATNDKALMKVVDDRPAGFWPVYKGESFDIWEPDTGKYYAWADPKKVIPELDRRRQSGRSRENSPFFEFGKNWKGFDSASTLSCQGPRVAFRDVTRATDTRTVRVALVPGKVFITNKGPYFLWPRGDERDQAYLLGVLSSIPLDWYSRRFVEVSLNYHILNAFPIPRPEAKDPLRERVIELAGRLAAADDRFETWAKAVGVRCGSMKPATKEDHIAELDAVVAHLYGLTEAHLKHIFETFHEGWDFSGRLNAVTTHFREWSGRK